jgi:putative ABC transport system ATP-binding protein
MTADRLLRLDAVERRYGSVTALRGVDLVVAAGEMVGIVGPSGSGKSTLLSIAAGWDQPTSGTVTRHPDATSGWSGTAIVPQGLGLLAELTARENIEIATGDDRHDVDRLLRSLGIEPTDLGDRLPSQLSLGQQQRVAIARALVASPRLVIADEPTAHQDEDHADRVMSALRDRVAAGAGILVSTHDRRLLPHLDRVVEVIDGLATER